MLSWKEYVAKHMRGKSFTSRVEANAYFKKLSIEYKKQK